VIVIIDHDQIAKLQMACKAGSFACNTLLRTPITKEAVSVVVNQIKTWLVEDRTSVCLGDGQANRIAETLTQRASCNLDTRGVKSFWVAGSDTIDML
jgi:hypothetical protein